LLGLAWQLEQISSCQTTSKIKPGLVLGVTKPLLGAAVTKAPVIKAAGYRLRRLPNKIFDFVRALILEFWVYL